ncbi:hypothetical protein BST81_16800 [Leptolyngbya sp. 'hensonii']|uniref:hypothetical protein n=1 Tax=Leptolyngbya sp. 'hensonii' TaxID=1922337 RepID=UPI00094FBBA4|nr:hypothetical protein [Leptolyngbya sp. 'hensonii']OLP17448.1 hypothetical protein BST81_16800 [Leptolyngbya sp. 'hensonii']
MRRLILFKAEKGEIENYRRETETQIGQSFYRIANAGSVPSLINTIAEHHDSSSKPAPTAGYRLKETVPEDHECFRDSGWEVIRVEEYTPEIPPPYGAGFDAICICYCAYKPLAPKDAWVKKAHRLVPSIASFGGDEKAYQAWLASQPEEVQTESRSVTEWLKTQEKQPTEV